MNPDDFTIELRDEASVMDLPAGSLALIARRKDGEHRSALLSRETVADRDALRSAVDDLLATFD